MSPFFKQYLGTSISKIVRPLIGFHRYKILEYLPIYLLLVSLNFTKLVSSIEEVVYVGW